jgi:hypothetical protein
MTDLVQVALITACASVCVGIIPGAIAASAASAARRAAERAERVTEVTSKAVDGRMTEMLELTRRLAFGEGMQQQRYASETIAAAVKEASALRPETLRQEKDQ